MFKRLVVLVLCFCAVAVNVLASPQGVYGRSADPATIDTWQMYFGDQVLTTDNAGKVWTDKSVLAADTAASQLPERWGEWKQTLVADEGDNFLVALSAMASNKSIVGRETIPTDTIFVLDVSSSMHNGSNLDPSAIQTMADATNAAIAELFKLNVVNRVGVVLYYGGGEVTTQSKVNHGIELLPLGRYTASEDRFITVKTIRQDEKVLLSDIIVDDSVRLQGSDTRPAAGNYEINGNKIAGTYAQRGIQIASDMFEKATTVVSEQEDEQQSGKHRKPILVLMTDGLPTAATHEFANVGDAYWGNNSNGERTDAETDFVTQLTLALTRERMANHYDKQTPLVYTLGLALTSTSPLAMDVLDPQGQDRLYENNTTALGSYSIYTNRASSSGAFTNTPAAVNRRIAQLWDRLVNQGQVSFEALASTGNINWQSLAKPGGNNPKVTKITVSGKKGSDQSNYTIANFPSATGKKYYVDQYFQVQSAQRLMDAFKSIVEEIRIQSKYYPTEVVFNPSMDGYLTFVDDIGHYMTVRDVKGIVSANQFYSGQSFARTIHEAITGNDSEYQNAYQAIISAMTERLGFTAEANAERLLRAAYAAGDIAWQSDNQFSNQVVWYATYDEQTHTVEYLPYSAMPSDRTIDDPLQRAEYNYTYYGKDTGRIPANAEYRITSYTFGGYDARAPREALETLYGFLRVVEQIQDGRLTGREFVDWRVPAALIPLLEYNVVIDNTPSGNNKTTLSRETATPIHALYEVGLRNDVDVYTVREKVDPLSENYNAQDDSYVFYANDWEWNGDPGDLGKFDYEAPSETRNAVAWFTPNTANEAFFFIKDETLYVKDGDGNYLPYTGETRPDVLTETMYYAHEVYQLKSGGWNGEDLTAETTITYHICHQPLGQALRRQNDQWYIPAGTAHPMISDGEDLMKNPNATHTLPYVEFASIRSPNAHGHTHGYFGISTLGNNGLIRLKPAGADVTFSGLKTVNGTVPGERVFEFELYETDADFNRVAEAAQRVASDKTTGQFAFEPIAFDRLGTYHYVIAEKRGQLPYMTYDPGEYRITVRVEKNQDQDAMVATVQMQYDLDGESSLVSQIVFDNRYMPPARLDTATLAARKLYNGAEPEAAFEGKFQFELREYETGKLLQTKTNGTEGLIQFDEIIFQEAGIFRYTISEVAPANTNGIHYDETRYLAAIQVDSSVDDHQQVFEVASVTYQVLEEGNHPSSQRVELPVFNNVKIYKIPVTGDQTPLALLAAAALVSAVALFGLTRKLRAGTR